MAGGSIRRPLASSTATGSSTNLTLVTAVFGTTDVQEKRETLPDPETSLHVVSAANLRSTGAGSSVLLMSMSNEFTLVPEPSTAATLALGLLGIALARSRR